MQHVAVYPRFRGVLQTNDRWRNRFHGEQIYIIGNGPSLNQFGPERLSKQRVIVMNSFDRAAWKGDVEIIAHCLGEPYFSSSWSDPTETILGTASASYWLHYSSLGRFADRIAGKNIHYVLPGRGARLWGSRPIDLRKVTLTYQTTAQLAVMVALYMGFRRIILLGFDHDWLASPDYSRHFFSADREPNDHLNRFSYYEILHLVTKMWENYYALRATAQANGAEIVNMTNGSFLDVFPRVSPSVEDGDSPRAGVRSCSNE